MEAARRYRAQDGGAGLLVYAHAALAGRPRGGGLSWLPGSRAFCYSITLAAAAPEDPAQAPAPEFCQCQEVTIISLL